MGITTLLSMTVFLMIVADSLPPSSDVVPLIGKSFYLLPKRKLKWHHFEYRVEIHHMPKRQNPWNNFERQMGNT
jgi:hypothetical protein